MAASPSRAPAPAAEPAALLCGNLGWLLSQATHALTTELTAALTAVGISPRGHCVLTTALSAPLTQTEIAQAVGLDKTTMVVTVDELEEAGLVRRVPSKTDRRARMIEVTRAGERKVAQAAEIVERIHADVLASLPAKQRDAFIDTLGRLVSDRLSTPVQCERPVRRRR